MSAAAAFFRTVFTYAAHRAAEIARIGTDKLVPRVPANLIGQNPGRWKFPSGDVGTICCLPDVHVLSSASMLSHPNWQTLPTSFIFLFTFFAAGAFPAAGASPSASSLRRTFAALAGPVAVCTAAAAAATSTVGGCATSL